MTKKFIDDASLNLSTDEIINLITICKTNGFNILNFYMDTLGIGIYSTASLFNHSCSPNCIVTFKGTQLCVTSIKHIESDTEITIPYVDIGIPKIQRQKDLKSHFFFDCDCAKCLNNENENLVSNYKPMESFDFDLIDEIEGEFDHVQSLCEKMKNNDEKIRIMIDCLGQILTIYPKEHKKVLLLYYQIYETFRDLNLMNEAVIYLRNIVDVYKTIYPENWPIVGVKLFELAQLEWQSNNFDRSHDCALKSKEILEMVFEGTSELNHLRLFLESNFT